MLEHSKKSHLKKPEMVKNKNNKMLNRKHNKNMSEKTEESWSVRLNIHTQTHLYSYILDGCICLSLTASDSVQNGINNRIWRIQKKL